MAKFKIGDRVKVINYKDITPYCSIKIGDCGVVLDDRGVGYFVDFNKEGIRLFFLEQNLELVGPENVFHVPSYAKEYWYNIDGDFSYLGILQEWSFDKEQNAYKLVFINPKKPENFNRSNVSFDKENYKKYLFTQEEKIAYEKEKKLVEPKEDISIHGKILSYGEHYYIRREDTSFRELGKLNTYRDDGIQAIMTFTPVENKLHLPLTHIHRLYTQEEMREQTAKDKIKKAFERPMIFGGAIQGLFDIDEELMKRLRDIKPPKFMTITTNPSEPNPFKLNPHEFPFHRRISGVRTQNRDDGVNTILSKKQFLLHDDLLDELQYTMSSAMGIPSKILFGRDINKPKNRIPDRVVFDERKGKVTVLISKFNDGEAPYRSYTSKVHGDDEYSGYFGFFLSYYKYLNRHLDGATRKELIDMAFEHGEHKEYIIEGAVSQEVMRLVKIDEWDNILTAILEVSKQNKGYWDYAEWKEMLRVHELETKREKQREVQKEIKKHQKAIEELKKKEV